MKHWTQVVWAAVLPQDSVAPPIGTALMTAAKAPETQAEVVAAMSGAWAVLSETCSADMYFAWLDRRGFAQPPPGCGHLIDLQAKNCAAKLNGESAQLKKQQELPQRGPAREHSS